MTGKLTDTGHRLEARIYYADTDFSGVVYHARYLEFLERGRIEYLRLVGVGYLKRADGHFDAPLAWIIRRLEIDFRRPARIDDLVTVETTTAKISSARVLMAQTIRRGADILITARVECALVNSSGRPQRFPKHWKELFRPQNDLT
ncbi:YbgC/FadM family acyl-CoA thioesterase [Mesorhizobium sp. LjNodule214]|uniref:YbgC/FadM family acyl-CoA thioesterase n=1 Tax=Mesorhizobium sp. LjNodule214 TaxID=3342252 RepID=UPI003ECC6D23